MNRQFRGIFPVVLALLVCIPLLSGGCAPGSEGFAVYLTEGDIPPAQMEALSHVNIAGEAVFTEEDIITYNADTHEITLNAGAYEHFLNLSVPVQGRSFLVCMDKQPLYWGAFWTPISSHSFSGVVIQKPLGIETGTIIKIEWGYPSPAFQGGSDPRDNADVMASLKRAGKLTRNSSASMLPPSMKGYELYSWVDNDRWQYVLMPGTNRLKTLEEIIAVENGVSADGWAHVTGEEALESLIRCIPRDEYVTWMGGLRGEPVTCCAVNLTLPPEAVIEAVKTSATACGINLAVFPP